jgi:hypothetical protein
VPNKFRIDPNALTLRQYTVLYRLVVTPTSIELSDVGRKVAVVVKVPPEGAKAMFVGFKVTVSEDEVMEFVFKDVQNTVA